MKHLIFLSFFLFVNAAFSQEEMFIDCDEYARFVGNMNQWITENLQNPKEVSEGQLVGKVYVKFKVEIDGSVKQVAVVKGMANCEACNKEALRLISSMPNWIPGKNCKGEIESQWCQIPLNFK